MKTKLSKILFSIMFTLLVVAGGAVFGACQKGSTKIEPEKPAEPSVVYDGEELPILVDDETLIKYVGEKNAMVDIPATYSIDEYGKVVKGDTYQITKIADGAFKNAEFYDAFIDISYVSEIGESAFENAKHITFGDVTNLRNIKNKAFYKATVNFNDMNFGYVTNFGDYCLADSTGYEIPTYSTLENVHAVTEYDMIFCEGGTIVNIGSGAFAGLDIDSSTCLYFGPGMIIINEEAFVDSCVWACYFQGGTYSIGGAAFYNCTMRDLLLEGNFTRIDNDAFTNDSYLNSVYVTETACFPNDCFAGNDWFTGCTNLNKVTRDQNIYMGEGNNNYGFRFAFGASVNSRIKVLNIPTSVTSIAAGALRGFGSLQSLTIPFTGSANNLSSPWNSSTANQCFGYIFGTTSYTGSTGVNQYGTPTFYIPNSLTTVVLNGDTSSHSTYASAFRGCSNITSITVSGGYTRLSGSAFRECTSLTSATINASITEFGANIFDGCTSLSAVTLPTSLQTMGNYDFQGCTSLSTVTLPTSLRTIGNYMFSGCTALTRIKIPSGVTSVGTYTFSGCTNLAAVNIPNTITSWDTSYAFYGCSSLTKATRETSEATSGGKLNFQFSTSSNGPSLTTFNLPNTGGFYFTTIDSSAFRNWRSLQTVGNLGVVSTIGNYAFYNCTALTSWPIGVCTTSLGSYAFAYAGSSSLTLLTLSAGVENIGSYCFQYCTYLKGVNIPSTILTINTGAFDGCTGLTKYTRNATAVTGSSGLLNFNFSSSTICDATTINIPNVCVQYYLTSSSSATPFANFRSLQTLRIPSPVIDNLPNAHVDTNLALGRLFQTSNPSSTYYNGVSQNGTTYYFPKTLTTLYIYSQGADYRKVNDYCCQNMSQLTNINCYDFTSIGSYAFQSCSSLTSISGILKSGIVTVYGYAFRWCSGLAGTLTIPNTVTTLYNDVFTGDNNITTVEFTATSQVSQIGNGCFNGCSQLSSITLPSSLIKLGNHVFYNCSSISTIYIPRNCTRIGQYCFGGSGISNLVFNDTKNWYSTNSGNGGSDWLMEGSTSGTWTSRDVRSTGTNATNFKTNGAWVALWWKKGS